MAVPEDLRELLEAGAHFGHQTKRWNPRMKPYIYASRDGVHVFDLTITAKLLDEACEYVSDSVANGKTVVMVGTKRQAKQIIREEAARVGAPFVAERWLGGLITNWEEMGKRVKKLIDMKAKREAGEYKRYTKKENVLINREIVRLERFFGGIAELKKNPDVLFVVDTLKEKAAIKEAVLRGIKVVAIVDSNSDPDVVDYPIPANDDAVRSLKYIINRIADAYAQGAELAKKKAAVRQKEEASKVQVTQDKVGAGAKVQERVQARVGGQKAGSEKTVKLKFASGGAAEANKVKAKQVKK